jgi:hypothetical protein
MVAQDDSKQPQAGFVEKLKSLFGKKDAVANVLPPATEEVSGCCESIVHIAYRGISDDRLYMAYDRKWREVKFFRGSLRVYCAGCRRKLYP